MADFAEWQPDLPEFGHTGLVAARNIYADAIGYRPIKALSQVITALPEDWQGGGPFIDADGSTVTLAGADGGMYAWDGASWSLKYAGGFSEPWQFAQFGGLVIAVNGAAPLKYTMSGATAALLGGSPPSATMVAIVRDFVFLAGDSGANTTVSWSADNNSEGWTPDLDQSGYQPLPDGGPITGLAGGEYGLVFQDAAIHRFSYVGTPLVFQRDKVSDGIGCVASGSITQFGRMVFFLSSRGFYAFNDGALQPIGKNRVDRTFWQAYPQADVIRSVRATVDPERSLAIWSMPDRLWIYNWDLDRWSDADLPGVRAISTGVNSGVTLEQIDALYPGGIDSVPISLDDPIFKGGRALLSMVKSDNAIYAFAAGTNLPATIRMAIAEPVPGRDVRIRRARIVGDMTGGTTLAVDHAQRLGDTFSTVEATTLTTSGDMPIRVRGRYIQPSVEINGEQQWSYIKGLELQFAAGAVR